LNEPIRGIGHSNADIAGLIAIPTGEHAFAAILAAQTSLQIAKCPTCVGTRNFFLWLSREPGFRSKLNANDANYFTPSEQDRRIAGARREAPVPTLNEIDQVLDRQKD
jgi:hypothetical protein